MARYAELTWYVITEAIPAANYPVLIKIKSDPLPNTIYRAKRVELAGTRYGFLFVLTNEYGQNTVPDDKITEDTAFCPANITEWAYLA